MNNIENQELVLLWFDHDLRVHDHEPLHTALSQNLTPICIYCCDPRQFGQTSFGFPKTGIFRLEFLHQALINLRQNIQDLGGDLWILWGEPEVMIPQLSRTLKTNGNPLNKIFFHQAITSEEVTVQNRVIDNLALQSITAQTFTGHSLLHPDDLPFSIAKLPELFTNFRKQVEYKTDNQPDVDVRDIYPTPKKLPDLNKVFLEVFLRQQQTETNANLLLLEKQISNLQNNEFYSYFLDDLNQNYHSPLTTNHYKNAKFHGGEAAGLARLGEYFWQKNQLRTYKQTRNGMLGNDYASRFSPWLALGCLSPRYIYHEVKRYEMEREANDSTYWLIFELLWRDYFYFIAAKHGNKLFRVGGLRGLKLPWRQAQRLPHRDFWEAWCKGKTGFPLVDANMRELLATGFMSNRGRQNVASFLTKNLGLDWRMGAEWFESWLVDYDVTSNWGNWNYTAGVGNDARGFRFFNITKQAQDYDADGKYVKYWLPELQAVSVKHVHQPWLLSKELQIKFDCRIGVDYPAPVVDLWQSAKANERIYNEA
jgi:deoxyribodipyrimidine photo-lyase